MADNLTNAAENLVVDHITGVASWTPTAPLMLALYLVAPTDSTAGTEMSGDTYTRMAISFGAASNGVAANDTDIVFPTAGAAWGDIVAGAVFDSAGTPIQILHGPLAVTKTIGAGDTFKVLAGDLTFSLT